MTKPNKIMALFIGLACALSVYCTVYGQIASSKPKSRQIGSGPRHEAYQKRIAQSNTMAKQAYAAWQKEKDLPKAESLFKQALAIEPNHGFNMYFLAQVLDEEGKTQEAQRQYEKVVYPKDGSGSTMQSTPSVVARYAVLSAEVGKRRESDAALQQAIDLLPLPKGTVAPRPAGTTTLADHKKAVYALAYGLELSKTANTDSEAQAMEQFQKAVKAEPGLAVAHLYLGYTLRKAGKNADAEKAFQKAVNGRGEVKAAAEAALQKP